MTNWTYESKNGVAVARIGQYVAYKNSLYEWDDVVFYMDDEPREEIHREYAPCSDVTFLEKYIEKAGDDFLNLVPCVYDGEEWIAGEWYAVLNDFDESDFTDDEREQLAEKLGGEWILPIECMNMDDEEYYDRYGDTIAAARDSLYDIK